MILWIILAFIWEHSRHVIHARHWHQSVVVQSRLCQLLSALLHWTHSCRLGVPGELNKRKIHHSSRVPLTTDILPLWIVWQSCNICRYRMMETWTNQRIFLCIHSWGQKLIVCGVCTAAHICKMMMQSTMFIVTAAVITTDCRNRISSSFLC